MNPDDPRLRKWIERVELFRGLSPSDVYKIYSKGMTMKIGKGEPVFHKGTTGNSMYVILGGAVGIFDGEKQLARRSVGDTFGEMSLLTGEPRSASVIALEDCRLFMLDEDVFERLLTKKVAVQILMNIGRMLAHNIQKANLTIREIEGR